MTSSKNSIADDGGFLMRKFNKQKDAIECAGRAVTHAQWALSTVFDVAKIVFSILKEKSKECDCNYP